jgi:hypothetical protein
MVAAWIGSPVTIVRLASGTFRDGKKILGSLSGSGHVHRDTERLLWFWRARRLCWTWKV